MQIMFMIRSLLRHAAARYALVVIGTMIATALVVRQFQPPPHTITQIDKVTQTIEVPVDRLTTKIVKEYVRVEDKAAVTALMRDNEALRVQVQQLSISLAAHTSTGTGPVVVSPAVVATPTTPAAPATTSFKDWRLSFTSDGTTARYTLTQQFSILNTVGANKNGVPVNLVRLFEIGPDGVRTNIPITETTTVAATPNLPHWYVKATIQAGAGVSASFAQPKTTSQEFIAAFPWWKRGRTETVEDTRYALLTPAVTVRGRDVTVGVLPVSLNLGTVLRSPLTDVWVSPFVGLTLKTQQKRFGVFLTATF